MGTDLILAVQEEVARLRDMISTAKALLPTSNVNFIAYEIAIGLAEKAIREHDTVSLIRMLPDLQTME